MWVTSEGHLHANKVYGSVWNDYAEYRTQIQKVEPGYCVISNDKGEVSKTNQHLSPCDGMLTGFSTTII